MTTVLRGANWNAPPLFTLLGANEVKDIRFKDSVKHALEDRRTKYNQSFLQIGRLATGWSSDPPVVDTIMIHDNTFDNAINGLWAGDFPIRHLYVVRTSSGAGTLGSSSADRTTSSTTSHRSTCRIPS